MTDNAVTHSRKREYPKLDVANCSHLDLSSRDLTQRISLHKFVSTADHSHIWLALALA